jgi:hypothetical protein
MAMTLSSRALATALLAFGASLLFAGAAMADTVIPTGHNVTEATVVGENLTLNGTSAGSVIVVDGNLTLGPRARANHGITVIGGHITTAPGAVVHGDVLQIGTTLPHLSPARLSLLLGVAVVFRLAVVWLIWRIAMVLRSAQAAQRMLAGARARPIRALLVGALVSAGLGAAALLLAISVIAIPIALALVGVLVACATLGCSFALRASDSRSDDRLGLVVLAVPVIGDAALALATILGTGAVFHHLVNRPQPQPRGAYP